MRAEHTGVVVARGIGLGLILLGICSSRDNVVLASFFDWQEILYGGGRYLMVLIQILIGAGMILFAKPVGRWLAMGLKDDDSES